MNDNGKDRGGPSTSKVNSEVEEKMCKTQETKTNLDVDAIVEEGNLNRIRNLLNDNKIQLWKAPYYDAQTNTTIDERLLELSCKLAPALELDDIYIAVSYTHLTLPTKA